MGRACLSSRGRRRCGQRRVYMLRDDTRIMYDFDVTSAAVTRDGSNNVSAISDAAGKNSAAQASAQFKPLYQATGMNGGPCVQYTGDPTNPQFLGLGVTPTAAQFSLFSVAAKVTDSASNMALAQTNEAWFYARTTAQDKVSVDVTAQAIGATALGTSPSVCEAIVRAANDIDLRVNGVGSTVATGTAYRATGGGRLGIYVGGGTGTAGAVAIGRSVMIAAAYSADWARRVRRILGAKRGITVT
jgi:hypothetical protein